MGRRRLWGVKGEVERTGGVGKQIGIREDDMEMGGIEGEEGPGGAGGEDWWVEVTVDMLGQRDDDAMVVFLAQMIHEGLVADGILRARLVINRRWHWRLYIDVRSLLSLLIVCSTSLANTTLYMDANKLSYRSSSSRHPHTYPLPPPQSNNTPRAPLNVSTCPSGWVRERRRSAYSTTTGTLRYHSTRLLHIFQKQRQIYLRHALQSLYLLLVWATTSSSTPPTPN